MTRRHPLPCYMRSRSAPTDGCHSNARWNCASIKRVTEGEDADSLFSTCNVLSHSFHLVLMMPGSVGAAHRCETLKQAWPEISDHPSSITHRALFFIFSGTHQQHAGSRVMRCHCCWPHTCRKRWFPWLTALRPLLLVYMVSRITVLSSPAALCYFNYKLTRWTVCCSVLFFSVFTAFNYRSAFWKGFQHRLSLTYQSVKLTSSTKNHTKEPL